MRERCEKGLAIVSPFRNRIKMFEGYQIQMADKKVILLYRRSLQINKGSVFTQVSSKSGKTDNYFYLSSRL